MPREDLMDTAYTLGRLTERLRVVAKVRMAGGEQIDAGYILLKLTEELHVQLSGQTGKEIERAVAHKQLSGDVSDLLAFLLIYADLQNIDLPAAIERKWKSYEDRAETTRPA